MFFKRKRPRPLWLQHIVTFTVRYPKLAIIIAVAIIVLPALYVATWDSNPLSAAQRAKTTLPATR